MSNSKKTAEISIRLPKQATLPTPKELIEMAHEARKAKKRIELPWQPEGRPGPALITVEHDDKTSKLTWSILNSHKSDGTMAWTDIDPDPTKIVLALRDWYAQARQTEGWDKGTPAQNSATDPNLPQPAPLQGGPPPGGPTNPSGYPMQQPYPQSPGGVPGWSSTYPAQAPYGYQSPSYAVPPAPPHWAQSAPNQPAQHIGEQPLPPELWALHKPQQPHSPMLGDLLVAAGVIPTRTLQAALTLQNTANMDRRRIGEILVSSGALPTKVLEAAVKLQDMARTNIITNYRVTELLRQVHSSGCGLQELLGEVAQSAPMRESQQVIKPRGDQLLEDEGQVTDEDREKLKQVMALLKHPDFTGDAAAQHSTELMELFKKASIVNEQTIEAEMKAAKNNPVDAVKALLVKELIDPTTFEAGLHCQKLMGRDRLKIEQAVIALGYCSRSRVGLRDAISDLNWLIPVDGI